MSKKSPWNVRSAAEPTALSGTYAHADEPVAAALVMWHAELFAGRRLTTHAVLFPSTPCSSLSAKARDPKTGRDRSARRALWSRGFSAILERNCSVDARHVGW